MIVIVLGLSAFTPDGYYPCTHRKCRSPKTCVLGTQVRNVVGKLRERAARGGRDNEVPCIGRKPTLVLRFLPLDTFRLAASGTFGNIAAGRKFVLLLP
jgi:hypothetical protein